MQEIDIVNNLRQFRNEKGITQTELADMAGVTRQTIGLIEAGRYNPTIKLCLILGSILGRGIDEIFMIEKEK